MPPIEVEDQRETSGRVIAEYPVPQGKLVLALEGAPPGWVEPLLKRLARLLALPPDWNSYGGPSVDPAIAWTAWSILADVMGEDVPLPTLVPTRRGGIQIEWHTRGIDLEVEVAGPQRLLISFEDAASGESWDKEATQWRDLSIHIARLAGGEEENNYGRGAP